MTRRDTPSLLLCLSLCAALASGCDNPVATDTDGGARDAGSSGDAGESRADSGTPRDGGAVADGGGATDGGAALDGGPAQDGGAASDAGGASDAGRAVDASSPSGCPCFGAAEIAVIDSHTSSGGTRECMTGVASGTFIDGFLSSTSGPQSLRATVQEISGFAGVDWFCGVGCADLNDDLVDDCAGAALPAYESRLVTKVQHDACEALIRAACGE